MNRTVGAFERVPAKARRKGLPVILVPVSFFLLEAFGLLFLSEEGEGRPFFHYMDYAAGELDMADLWPLAFGGVWAALLTGLIFALPARAGRIAYGLLYYLFLIYAVAQTGYYLMFGQMLWISEFAYASEGADYLDVLLQYPLAWWLSLAALIALGAVILRFFPQTGKGWGRRIASALAAAVAAVGAVFLPELVFRGDGGIQYAGSDYGRAQSAEAAYDNLFNPHRLYQVCGLYQTAVKDVYAHFIYPATPGYVHAQQAATEEIDAYFARQPEPEDNAMTGLLAGKNVVLVLMESMDDWMIGAHTPTISRLMEEGINFTRFYTPGYGGIRTFNTEFCINTGSFLSTSGGYAFDYVTNQYNQSLASLLTGQGYSAMVYHYNSPAFYSRGVFSQAMGYEAYHSYQDYTDEKDSLYDDQFLFDCPALSDSFFREGKKLNFIITRSAHLSYKYNEVLSYWGLKKYPQYRTLTDNEETNCALLKARLVDDLFARLLTELEEHGVLEDTVIVAVTDHYTYGYKNEKALLELSQVERKLLLERTPAFIWSPGLEPMEVDKVLNTSDMLPTLLNLLGVNSPYRYIGSDAFDQRYDGFVPFSNGSWIWGDAAFDADKGACFTVSGQEPTVTAEEREQLEQRVRSFVNGNNQILETDYYREAG